MPLSRKHYVLFARELGQLLEAGDITEQGLEAIGDVFYSDNQRFNWNRFRDAVEEARR